MCKGREPGTAQQSNSLGHSKTIPRAKMDFVEEVLQLSHPWLRWGTAVRLGGLSTVPAAVCEAQECSSGGLTQLGAFPIKNGLLSKLEDPTVVILGTPLLLFWDQVLAQRQEAASYHKDLAVPTAVFSSSRSTADRGSHCTRSGSCVAASLPCSGPHTQVTCACCPHTYIFR